MQRGRRRTDFEIIKADFTDYTNFISILFQNWVVDSGLEYWFKGTLQNTTAATNTTAINISVTSDTTTTASTETTTAIKTTAAANTNSAAVTDTTIQQTVSTPQHPLRIIKVTTQYRLKMTWNTLVTTQKHRTNHSAAPY